MDCAMFTCQSTPAPLSKLRLCQGMHVCGLSSEQRKRSLLDGQTPCCPVCGITLRSGEVEAHYIMELEKLDKISR